MYTVKMLERGFLAGTFIYPTIAHNDEIVLKYCDAIEEVFAVMSNVLQTGDLDKYDTNTIVSSGFARLL